MGNLAKRVGCALFVSFVSLVSLRSDVANAQTNSFQWAKRVASTVNDDFEPAIGLSLDNQGNVFVTGWFDGVNDFGGVTLTSKSLGGQDIFVARYDANGALQWARRAGGPFGWNAGRGVGVDTAGNVYVTGGFYGVADFGKLNATTFGNEEFFLAKYDHAGVIQWVKQSVSGGGRDGYGTGLAVDGAGNSYALVLVENGPTITFGSTTLSTPNNSSESMCLVKHDSKGTVQWAKLMSGADQIYGTKVAVDAAGNVYARGSFRATLNISGTSLTNTGKEDTFTAKFDSAGNLLWVRQIGGAGASAGGDGGVAIDQAGNVFIGGGFQDNPIIFGNTKFLSVGSYDAFIGKYDSAGTPQWGHKAAGQGTDFYVDVALDAQGNVYAGGALSADVVSPKGTGGAAIVKYDSAGNLEWAYSATGELADPVPSLAAKVAIDATGNIFLAGWYFTKTTFDATVLLPQDTLNFFLAKLGSGTPVPPTPPSITSQPQNQTVNAGQNVAFTVTGTGTAPLSYQWRKNGVNINGQTTATLNLTNAQGTDAGSYDVVITNAAGNMTSIAAILTVNVAAPSIAFLSTANGLTLLWPNSATSFRLESALSLSPPITWSNVTGTFQTNGGSISIVLPSSGSQKFFRLVQP